MTDKGSEFPSQKLQELMNESGITINHATLEHAQTIGMIERNHQRLKQMLRNNAAEDTPH